MQNMLTIQFSIILSMLNECDLDFLWNIIWSLVQLVSYNDNIRTIRAFGGIHLIIFLLKYFYFVLVQIK
jgi:hypothetical protein